MKFYTSVNLVRNNILLRGYKDGERIQESIPYQPYLFISSKTGNSKYKTMQGQPVDKLMFDSVTEARDFYKTYENVAGMTVYGFDRYAYTFIYDEYPGELQYDPSMINVVTMDIEVASDEGFPDIQRADNPVTAITLRRKDEYIVLGCRIGHKHVLLLDVEYVLIPNQTRFSGALFFATGI